MSIAPTGYQIDISFRNFLFMRGHAIKETRDALTELITNSIDAYRKLDNYSTIQKYVYIAIHIVYNKVTGSNDFYLQVVDRASGVDPENMKKCFMVAGNSTSNDGARGFFSTGAKNITVLGDVHYTSIKDTKLSKIYLDDMAYGHIVTAGELSTDSNVVPDVVGVDATDVQRQILTIPSNGMNVVLAYTNPDEIKKLQDINVINDMLNSVSKIATLRDIFSDPTITIIKDIRNDIPYLDILNTNNYNSPIIHTDYSTYDHSTESNNFGGMYYSRLTYEYPLANLYLSTIFKVPNFEQYDAKFVIYKTDKPIDQPLLDNQLEFGFLIKDDVAIHEVNTLGINERFRWNPNINYLYGYLHCPGFTEELKKYDRGESTELILDPNRINGINKEHPLYKSLLSVCLPRLDEAILAVQNQSTIKSINIDELDTIVNKLEELGVNIFNENKITFNFTQADTANLVLALKSTENNIVREVRGDVNIKLLADENIIKEQIQQMELDREDKSIQYIYYYNLDTNEIGSIPAPIQTTSNPNNTGDISINNTITQSNPNNQEKQLQCIVDSLNDLNITTPTIYRLNEGDWTKINIFEKGRLSNLSDDVKKSIQLKQKSITIQFINDINYTEKYLIDTTNGIIIKINLHNPVVADKLSKTKINNTENDYSFKISNEASYDALNFLHGLMTSAFTDIVVNNDVQIGRLPLNDSDPVGNGKKVLDYWNRTETKIDTMMNSLFKHFLNVKKEEMLNNVKQSVELAKLKIMEMFLNSGTSLNDVEQGATQLASLIQDSVTSLISK